MGQTQTIGKTATTVRCQDDLFVIRYHQTDVVTFDKHKIELDSGGWDTATTKTRMNQTSNQFGLGFQVFQKEFKWFVDFKDKTLDFFDGMILNR